VRFFPLSMRNLHRRQGAFEVSPAFDAECLPGRVAYQALAWFATEPCGESGSRAACWEKRGVSATMSARLNKEVVMEIKSIPVAIPEGANIIFGQSHFIKTVEDLYEAMVTSAPGARFGIAFCEASGPRLVRRDGNDSELIGAAVRIAESVGAGHSFIVVMKDAFPISALNAVKSCQEVCCIFCATANPVEILVAVTEQGRGVLGVVDGESPVGVESERDAADRREFLMKIGYKR